jgi:hypothetical protein
MQRKSNILLVFLIVLLLGASCNKDKNVKTVVNGTVINLSENKPLAGVQVKLVEGYGFASNTGSNTIETVTTNSDGTFKFNFTAVPSR